MMNHGFNQFAEALVFVHGTRAEAEAARHAVLCERSGDTEFAATWRRLQMAVREVRNCPRGASRRSAC